MKGGQQSWGRQVAFSHLLPNFIECWWDAIILDILLCNGLGIWVGMQFCHLMEMRYYNWESIKDIQTTTGKLKRAVLQFTPESWTAMRWLDPACTYMRFLAVSQLVVFWQLSELNTFFLKHIFQMPPSHPLVFMRIFLLGAMSAPTIRQYYSYVTDPRCKRVGTQCWVYGLCMCIESLICIKFGADIFQHTQIRNIIVWILIQAAGSVMCVYLCVTHHRWQRKRQIRVDDSLDDDTETDSKVSSYIQSLPRKQVTLSTPEDEDSDDEAEGPMKVHRRKKNPPLRRTNRLEQ